MKTKRQGHYCKGCGDFLLNNNKIYDFEELIYNESLEISKKRRQHLEVISSIHLLNE